MKQRYGNVGSFPRRGIVCLFAMTVMVPQLVLADTVILRDGTRLEGLVANREQVASNPKGYEYISLLIDETEEFRRLLTADIQYILLVDNGEKRVIEFETLWGKSGAPVPEAIDVRPRSGRRERGIGMMILGGGLGLFGALAKFGDTQVTITSSGVDYDEKTYNTANYILMVGGGVMFIVGAVWAATPNETTDKIDTALIEFGERETRIGVKLRF